MIQVWVDEVSAEVRKLPAEECRVEGMPDESIVEISLDDFVLSMPEEVAEDLYNSLAFHFSEL